MADAADEAGARLGGCLCGAVRFSIAGPLEPIQLCYCAQCRKAQGGPFVSVVPVATASFTLRSGADALTAFESSPGKERVFCGRCGSPLFSRRMSAPEVLRVRAGAIEGALGVRPARHAYVDELADWWTIEDGLPRYPEAGP